MTAILLAAVLPLIFIIISRVPAVNGQRSIVVGNDPAGIEDVAEVYEKPVLGYVAPPSQYQSPDDPPETAQTELTDGGNPTFQRGYVGGLSRFEETVREYAVDAAILAFDRADRGEFFGALHTCYDNGIEAKAHIDHMDSLLVSSTSSGGPIVDIELEPWDTQDRLLKRLFDILFAVTALLVLSPLILVIAAAILIEGNGPILFSQNRTYRFGDTFTIYKFRTLKPEPNGEVGTTFGRNRETPLGNFLRMTHLDEIPQLWSILIGDMSVVGPRPAQTDLEGEFEDAAATWKRRWFVKPGLTGLAQIRDATSEEPALKIDYDVEYIRCQSFTFDLKIVIRQLWQVVRDVASIRTDQS
jgi:lipopolysaccharide/colanic/teichoic acid biosynthesis glycosyltransferase